MIRSSTDSISMTVLRPSYKNGCAFAVLTECHSVLCEYSLIVSTYYAHVSTSV